MNLDVNGNWKLFWKEVRMEEMEKIWKIPTEYRMEMGGWHRERMKCEGSGRSILKLCINKILRKRLQSTCVALIGVVTTSEKSKLEELRFR